MDMLNGLKADVDGHLKKQFCLWSKPLCAAFSVLKKYSTKCQLRHFYPFVVD